MLAALERLTLTATRALSVVGLIALMGLAAMTLTDGLLRSLANRPIPVISNVLMTTWRSRSVSRQRKATPNAPAPRISSA